MVRGHIGAFKDSLTVSFLWPARLHGTVYRGSSSWSSQLVFVQAQAQNSSFYPLFYWLTICFYVFYKLL